MQGDETASTYIQWAIWLSQNNEVNAIETLPSVRAVVSASCGVLIVIFERKFII